MVKTVVSTLLFVMAALCSTAQMSEPHEYGSEITTIFTPSQDTAFNQAARANVTARARWEDQCRSFSALVETTTVIQRPPTPWEIALKNMAAITPEMIQPSAEERTQHELGILRSQYVPGVLLYPMGTGNLTVNMGDIGRVLGLAEDVSPHITYAVPEAAEVRILIYSTSAMLVRELYRGVQRAGRYEIDWDGKNDSGRTVTRGDYIAEVQVGTLFIYRKRITLQ